MQPTDSERAAASAFIFVMLILIIVMYIIVSILLGRIFKKADVPQWKAWVPVYNTWTTLALGNQQGWLALLTLIPVINFVSVIFLYIAMYHIGLKLGKDKSFVLWALFLPLVWYAWLALDDSTWNEAADVSYTPNTPDDNPPTSPAM